MTRGTWLRRSLRDGGFALLGILAIVVALYIGWRVPGESNIHLKMTAGRTTGERHRIAEGLKREGVGRSLYLDLVGTPGSAAAITALDERKLDVALVQGGFDLGNHPNLCQVAMLHVEPLHLLVKEEWHSAVSTHLLALRGKTVALGDPGSGTYALSRELLNFAGLRPGDYKESVDNTPALVEVTDRSKLPDAVFLVSSLPSSLVRSLVALHNYRLVPLPYYEAFTLGAIDRERESKTPLANDKTIRIDRRHVYRAQIPAFAYEVEPGVPPNTMETLGTRLLVVARKDVSRAAVMRLLDLIYASPFAQSVQPPIDTKLLDNSPELTWHDGTVSYQRRNAPVIAGDVIDMIEKEVSILGALIGVLFFLGQWIRRRYLKRQDLGFQAYIMPVHEIERKAIALEREATLELGPLLELQEELNRLKGEALKKFAEGELTGETLMSGFLTHVDNTRDYLTRMILHEREYLEKKARVQGRESPELWREAIEGFGAIS